MNGGKNTEIKTGRGGGGMESKKRKKKMREKRRYEGDEQE